MVAADGQLAVVVRVLSERGRLPSRQTGDQCRTPPSSAASGVHGRGASADRGGFGIQNRYLTAGKPSQSKVCKTGRWRGAAGLNPRFKNKEHVRYARRLYEC